LNAEREVCERLDLVVAGGYHLLALLPAIAQERGIIADNDNHRNAPAELRQFLFDQAGVTLMETHVNGGQRPIVRGKIPRFGELPLRAWVRELHKF